MKNANYNVVIARKWAKHTISITVNEEEIKLSMPLDDYFAAILEELGSPTFVLTKSQLADKLHLARLHVEATIKDTSKYVV